MAYLRRGCDGCGLDQCRSLHAVERNQHGFGALMILPAGKQLLSVRKHSQRLLPAPFFVLAFESQRALPHRWFDDLERDGTERNRRLNRPYTAAEFES